MASRLTYFPRSLNLNAGLGSRRGALVRLAAVLIAGLAIRLFLLPTPGHKSDLAGFAIWSNDLANVPWHTFYDVAGTPCDYLPGYLYVLAAIGFARKLLSGGVTPSIEGIEPWIKMGPVLADLAIAATAYWICCRFTTRTRALMAAALVVLNPATIFVGAVWGQVDSIGVAISLLALLSLLKGRPTLAAVLTALAFLVKPHYAVFLAIAAVGYLSHEVAQLPSLRARGAGTTWASWATGRVLLPLVVFAVVVQSLLLPFSISLWRAPNAAWTLQERLSIASQWYPFASAGAFNFWGIHAIKGLRRPDNIVGWLSVNYQTWGFILLASVVVLAAILVWRRRGDRFAILWGCFMVAFAFFEVTTRVHERYLFAAMPLLGMLTAIRPRLLLVYLGLSTLYLLNLWRVWAESLGYLQTDFELGYSASDFSALIFLACLISTIAMLARPVPPTLAATIPSGRSFDWRAATILMSAIAAGSLISGTLGEASLTTGAGVRTTIVRASESWQDSGIQVKAGDKISIVVMGRWSYEEEVKLHSASGVKDLDPDAIIPTAPVGAMLGQIGASTPFVVGDRIEFTATVSGSLRLVINDRPASRRDNRGRVEALIGVSKD